MYAGSGQFKKAPKHQSTKAPNHQSTTASWDAGCRANDTELTIGCFTLGKGKGKAAFSFHPELSLFSLILRTPMSK